MSSAFSTLQIAAAVLCSLVVCTCGAPLLNQVQKKATEPKATGLAPKIQDPLYCPPVHLGGEIILSTVGCDICVPQNFSRQGIIGIDCVGDSNGQHDTTCKWEHNGEEVKTVRPQEVFVSQEGAVANLFFQGNIGSHIDQSYTCVCENEFGKDEKVVNLIGSLTC